MEINLFNNQSKYVWLADPGHGYNTAGKRSPLWLDGSQLFEYDFNRKIARIWVKLLNSLKINNVLIVPETIDISRKVRIDRANLFAKNHKHFTCIFISMHSNANGIDINNLKDKANGIEVFTSPGRTRSDIVATVFYKHLVKMGLKMRPDFSDGDPDKEARFDVLTKTTMPAILCEIGFYTNEIECKKMLKASFQLKAATQLVNAIKEIEQKQLI